MPTSPIGPSPTLPVRQELERLATALEKVRDVASPTPRQAASAPDAAASYKIVETCIYAAARLTAVADAANDVAADTDPLTRRALLAVVDTCFIVQCDLRPLLPRLERQQAPEALSALIEATHRKVRRACNRILVSLGPIVEGTSAKEDFSASVLETSLAVRRHYARFRRALPRPELGAAMVLETAHNQITCMLELADANDLRIQDEMELKSMAGRIESWQNTGRAPQDAQRLLTEVYAFADELRRVSERRELRTNDARQIETVLTLLAVDTANIDRVWGSLSFLEGLDDELDRLTAERTREGKPLAVEVHRRLQALRSSLTPPRHGAPPPPPPSAALAPPSQGQRQ